MDEINKHIFILLVLFLVDCLLYHYIFQKWYIILIMIPITILIWVFILCILRGNAQEKGMTKI